MSRPEPAPPVTVFSVGRAQDGARLDHFLKERIPALSRRRVQEAIGVRVALLRVAAGRAGAVPLPTCAFPMPELPLWVRAARPERTRRPRAATQVRAGDRVVVWPSIPEESWESWEVPVVFEDEHLLAADKPAGLVVHATRRRLRNTLLGVLRRSREDARLALAHRIDRETSGLVLLSRCQAAARALSAAFAAGRVRKAYVAVVHGVPEPRRGAIALPIGPDRRSGIHVRRAVAADGAPALTEYAVARQVGEFALLRLRPRSGRRHQIRVHLEAIGHPVVGDKLYGGDPRWYLRALERGESEAMRRALLVPRHLLHASALCLRHPLDGRPLRLRAPLPADMRGFLEARRSPERGVAP